MRFYFASNMGNIRKLRANSLLSSKASIVYNLSLLDFKSGEKLAENRPEKPRIPRTHPYIYKGVINQTTIENREDFRLWFDL